MDDGETSIDNLNMMCQKEVPDYMAEQENMQLQENQNLFIACA